MFASLYLTAVAALLLSILGCVNPPNRPGHPPAQTQADWRTTAERTDYQQTGRYADVCDFCRRLAAATPYARYTTFGVSGEGRPLPLLILSRERAFTRQLAAAGGKLLVLVQNCIHAGECEGKDASLALARDILITRTRADLLDHVNLLIMPIFNADGHERMSRYSRINQNGPQEMGWRVTGTNLNLNRDYAKADAVEMQAWLRCWTAWQPDLFFDNHTTDGEDCQYDLFYTVTAGADVDEHVAAWVRDRLLASVLPALAADGHLAMPYASARDDQDLSQGFQAATLMGPRFSTGYSAICNRPSILVETHALKPYEQRVRATYDIMVRTLEELNRNPAALRTALRAADEHCAATRGASQDGRLVLRQAPTDDAQPLTYKAIAQRLRHSDITGEDVVEYTGPPVDVETKLHTGARTDKAVVPPAAYLVPPQWTEVIRRLELHGIEFFRLNGAARLPVEVYRLSNVKFSDRSQEGRQRVSYAATPETQSRDFAAGTLVVPMNQPRAKVAVHLLEPDAPDALVAWGFFNAVLEQKEYAEAYIMEPLAQRMLAADPALQREFEDKLKTDEQFAKNPGARLNFFYQRSPYADEALNVYPVARLLDEAALALLMGRE